MASECSDQGYPPSGVIAGVMRERESREEVRTVESFELSDVAVGVVETVAAAKQCDPTEVDAQLHDAVDPDALASTVERIDGRVVFPMAGCEVVVHGDGRVAATPRPDARAAGFPSRNGTASDGRSHP